MIVLLPATTTTTTTTTTRIHSFTMCWLLFLSSSFTNAFLPSHITTRSITTTTTALAGGGFGSSSSTTKKKGTKKNKKRGGRLLADTPPPPPPTPPSTKPKHIITIKPHSSTHTHLSSNDTYTSPSSRVRFTMRDGMVLYQRVRVRLLPWNHSLVVD
mmetsp:Transcript_10252/g.12012  ORF Transcript_10252/g.12012 Transcript_10252/m.12012 type:complete len:157 (+) Transcript_10252:53-523(+)